MGNCCNPALSSAAAIKVQDKASSSQVVVPTTPVRSGAQGLLDYGFEYRVHEPCPAHYYYYYYSSQHQQQQQQQKPEAPEKSQQQQSASSSTTSTISLTCPDCNVRLFRLPQQQEQQPQEQLPVDDNENDNNNDNNNASTTNPLMPTMITTENRKTYIPPRIYDHIARLAQQAVISWLQCNYQMQWLPVFTHSNNTNNDNKSSPTQVVVQALVSYPPPPPSSSSLTTTTNDDDDDDNNNNNTLLILNGRGIARAGILSTRHTIESGIASGSAVVHIHRALHGGANTNHKMAVVCIDTNALGPLQGLTTVQQSLASPALRPYIGGGREQRRNLYVLCHSAAGGYFVQHLIQSTSSSSSSTTTDDENHSATAQQQPLFTIDQIKALAFTDSTHDLQWLSLKDKVELIDFLQSDTCLYIRNNREHVSNTFGPKHRDKPAGQEFYSGREQEQWKKRFGNIRTVYAGTPDHSLMCYQARDIIWEFFESKMQHASASTQQQQQPSSSVSPSSPPPNDNANEPPPQQ